MYPAGTISPAPWVLRYLLRGGTASRLHQAARAASRRAATRVPLRSRRAARKIREMIDALLSLFKEAPPPPPDPTAYERLAALRPLYVQEGCAASAYPFLAATLIFTLIVSAWERYLDWRQHAPRRRGIESAASFKRTTPVVRRRKNNPKRPSSLRARSDPRAGYSAREWARRRRRRDVDIPSGSRCRRGHKLDSPSGRVAAPPRPRAGQSPSGRIVAAAVASWIVRRDMVATPPRPRAG